MILLASCSPQAGPASSPAALVTATSTTNPGSLTVFAAASLTESFTEIGQRFEAENPGVKISFNFAGSQQLTQQLAQGAPADVFASADRKQMDAAVQASRVVSSTVQKLADNHLVVIAPKDNPAHLQGLADLARPGLKIILAAQEVPAGKYALDFLARASQAPDFGAAYQEQVLKNVVSYEENVRSVLSKVLLGEADAGIVYSTDALSAGRDKLDVIEIPAKFNVVANYWIAPVTDSRQAGLAGSFVAYTLSPTSQAILASHGFLPTK